MRILALYDIHGNADALEAVLADPRAAGPDAVVVGGDAVPGAFATAVLDRLQALSGDVRWVRGNGERETAAAVNGPRPAGGDNAAEMSAFTAQQLGPERARALGELPLSVIVDGVLFCHATPRSDEELVTRISPPERWSEVLTGVDAALVVAGHTHQQDDRIVGGVRFVNAGSVGLPYEGDGDARWLWIEDGVPELRRTAYDAATAGRRMRDACAALTDSVNASLIDPVEAIVVTRMFEERANIDHVAEHHMLSHHAARVRQPLGETSRLRHQQKAGRLGGVCGKDNRLRLLAYLALLGIEINDASHATAVIHGDLAHVALHPNFTAPGFFGNRQDGDRRTRPRANLATIA